MYFYRLWIISVSVLYINIKRLLCHNVGIYLGKKSNRQATTEDTHMTSRHIKSVAMLGKCKLTWHHLKPNEMTLIKTTDNINFCTDNNLELLKLLYIVDEMQNTDPSQILQKIERERLLNSFSEASIALIWKPKIS